MRWPDAADSLHAARLSNAAGSLVLVTRSTIAADWRATHDDADLRSYLVEQLGALGWSLTTWHVRGDVPGQGPVAYGSFTRLDHLTTP